eukprot:1155592-Pelagomonas_calceolata.AAC.6
MHKSCSDYVAGLSCFAKSCYPSQPTPLKPASCRLKQPLAFLANYAGGQRASNNLLLLSVAAFSL